MRWVVRPGDGHTVRDVLVRAGTDRSAVEEGRVFVGLRRVVREDEMVHEGDVLRVGAAQAIGDEVSILVHEEELVAANKPAGIPTIPDHAGAAHSLVAGVARAIAVDVARLHPTSRLDRDVSGVVFFALTARARERLAAARARGEYERRYIAIAAAAPAPERGTWDAAIGRARDPRLRAVGGREATHASTRYQVVARVPQRLETLLAVAPLTGRTHQIRVHASHAGAPLVGDRVYGGPARVTLPSGRVLLPGRVALHAARVVVPGERGSAIVAEAPIPEELRALWSALGGEGAAWEVSASCVLS